MGDLAEGIGHLEQTVLLIVVIQRDLLAILLPAGQRTVAVVRVTEKGTGLAGSLIPFLFGLLERSYLLVTARELAVATVKKQSF
jgi:hypothetical protein